MGDVPQVHLHVGGPPKDATAAHQRPPSPAVWWFLVALNILFLLAGQTAAVLLGRFYYDQGGESTWMATLVQTAGFPFLFLPLLLIPSTPAPAPAPAHPPAAAPPPVAKIAAVYIALGLIIAADNLMYSYGLLYLPVSTYSLVCASQLAFNVVLSYFLNSSRFTALVLNSVVLLTFSAVLLGVSEGSDGSADASSSKGKYALGFVLTLGASATYSLILSLMQLAFERVIKKETFAAVLEMQIYTALVASCASVAGLFASGEWRGATREMDGYGKGRVSYVMTLAGTALAWQVASVGVVGLIFVVSSLFSNAVSTLALPVVPVFAVIFFHDKMDGAKVMALLIAIWGFVSYLYQQYLDDAKAKEAARDDAKAFSGVSSS